MTRSNKGSKPPGYDFWSKRPKSSHNDKDLTHRAERREGLKECTDLKYDRIRVEVRSKKKAKVKRVIGEKK